MCILPSKEKIQKHPRRKGTDFANELCIAMYLKHRMGKKEKKNELEQFSRSFVCHARNFNFIQNAIHLKFFNWKASHY